MRWSASASYVFYADNKWNVAFEAGFRRSASREPFLRGDLVAREEEGTNTHTHTHTHVHREEKEKEAENFGMMPWLLQRLALSSAELPCVPEGFQRQGPASMLLSLSLAFSSVFLSAVPTYPVDPNLQIGRVWISLPRRTSEQKPAT